MKLGEQQLAYLPAVTPRSFRDLAAFHAIALRASAAIDRTTRRGRPYRVPLYAEGFVFVYGRAIVELSAFTLGYEFPNAYARFLQSLLVGATQANEASL